MNQRDKDRAMLDAVLAERDEWRRQAQYETAVAQAAIEEARKLRAALNQQETEE